MKTRIGFSLIALLLAITACLLPKFGSDEGNQPTSNVLFQDDFSDPYSGWDQIEEPEGVTDYHDGKYRIYVGATNTDVWANPGLEFTDSLIDVEATKVGGDNNNDFGVICRYQDGGNFYFFVISSDGYYGIGKLSGGTQMLIGTQSMPPSEVILQGENTNNIRAGCVGSTLTLIVNGETLAEFEDTEFTSGDVGLLAGSFSNPGTEIYFDNFQALRP
jgi:hypothetical protein